ncbi:hypothetical protein D3227_11705 [Mesorhizobium waimense]|uniref:Uncharacterized protein n=1 Tax=Mesorhizobium waimense TaxID=1300307 RepID=A0A3A5L4C4_9HYPH|nr:hypothetical protein [Mesorhizobium waimense]RJT40041.1 hypothetical protein D3227_11705 [Mesorhizobium waimense]
MKTLFYGMTISAAIAAPAMAETRYDRNLEKAAMDIVAGKIGGIRGGFSYKQRPQFVVVPDAVEPPLVPAERPGRQASGDSNDGLAPAVERPISRTVF